MKFHRVLTLCIALCTLAPVAYARADAKNADSTANLTIAVADFSGSDKDLGRFLADTLLTDLAQSDRLRMTERTEIRQALAELKLQSTGLVEPQQVKKLGKLVGADRLIVGGYLLRDNQLLINARLLDVRTGRVMPGGAANVAGPRNDLFTQVHRLARLFHQRITGETLVLNEESRHDPSPADFDTARRPIPQETQRLHPLLPAKARPNSPVSEKDLYALAARLKQEGSILSGSRTPPLSETRPVTRMRALAALVKAVLTTDELHTYEGQPASQMPPDVRQIPPWGLAFVVAAVDRGWWMADRPIRPGETATWAFLDALLNRLPQQMQESRPSRTARRQEADAESDGCSGLIVDARGLPVERAMSVRILDEDGRVVYPDPNHLPSIDWLQDNGMAAYLRDIEEGERAGKRPLVVRAIGIASTGTEDVIVTNRTAERIREENRRGKFLWRWRVCFVVDAGR